MVVEREDYAHHLFSMARFGVKKKQNQVRRSSVCIQVFKGTSFTTVDRYKFREHHQSSPGQLVFFLGSFLSLAFALAFALSRILLLLLV